MSLDDVTRRIAEAAGRAGRDPSDVRLIAVSKAQPISKVLEVYNQGQREFAENRAQELATRLDTTPDDIRWHFVGRLQRNKIRIVRPSVVLLHSMDRLRLAAGWLKGPGMPPPVLLQVNMGSEPQKGGVSPLDAERVLAEIVGLGADVRGLMGIPPMSSSVAARRHFADLAALRDRLAPHWPRLRELSMGMTDDFEIAIEEGSTMVRVGRAIFGPREGDG